MVAEIKAAAGSAVAAAIAAASAAEASVLDYVYMHRSSRSSNNLSKRSNSTRYCLEYRVLQVVF